MPKNNRLRHPDGRFKSAKSEADIEKEEFLALAMERFKLAEAAESRYRREALEDFEFYTGNQWPADIKTQRDRDRKPCLTINRLKPSKRIITNEFRQQRPAIQVNPLGDGATVETADFLQGIYRHIEVGSDAEVADDIAFDHMVIGGLAWIEVSTSYKKGAKKRADGTKPQEIRIKAARRPFMHYADPTADEPDYSDADWHFKIHDFTRAEFKAKWPNAEAASLEDFSSVGDNASSWLSKSHVRVAEYWYMSTAPTEREDESEPADDVALGDSPDEIAEQKLQDDDSEPICWKSMITAVDILERKETVWDSIPNVPMVGEDLDINGERYIAGMVRDAKDPQRQFNYWETKCTEAIALAPMSPYKGYKEVIEGQEAQWQSANRNNDAVLVGNAIIKDGQLLPLPTRESPNVDIQGLAAMRQSAAANLEAVTGLNDATLGRVRPDESGKAVLARQKQGDITNLNYSDNASRTKRRVGRLILPAIRKVYDIPHLMRIIKPDGTTDHIITHVGADQRDAAEQLAKDNQAVKNILDLSVGSYDVTISVGPSYQTKRQEAVASIMALISAAPNVLSIVGDLLVGNMDWSNAPEIAKRMKKMLPAQLQDEDSANSPAAQAQQAQAQLAALQQAHQQVLGALQQAQQIIQTKQVEMQGKLGIEEIKKNTQLALAEWDRVTKWGLAEISTRAQKEQTRSETDAELTTEMHRSAHDLALATTSHQQTLEQQQQAQTAQAAQQAAAAQQQQQNSAPPGE